VGNLTDASAGRDCARRVMRAPMLAVADGALGFWGARCATWVPKLTGDLVQQGRYGQDHVQPLDLVDHRWPATGPEIWNPQVREKCSGAKLPGHVIT
jgi:hypothetical protein